MLKEYTEAEGWTTYRKELRIKDRTFISADMQEDRLYKAFEYVRETFFPEWDREQEWNLLDVPEELAELDERGVDGVCDEQAKVIKVNMTRVTEDEDDLNDLLIHEISHCYAKGHGERWQNIMLSKAKIADKIGRKELAERIRKDVSGTVVLDEYFEFRLERAIHAHVHNYMDKYQGISFDELIMRVIEDRTVPPDISGKLAAVFKKAYDNYSSYKAQFVKSGNSHNEQTNILVVEDGESQRILLKEFLIREGYLVRDADNGIKALQCVRDEQYDIILLDHKMPGMYGLEVLKEIKKSNSGIDVVIISAYGTLERAVEAVEAGAFYYITKPVDLEKLLVLLKHISKRRARIKKG